MNTFLFLILAQSAPILSPEIVSDSQRRAESVADKLDRIERNQNLQIFNQQLEAGQRVLNAPSPKIGDIYSPSPLLHSDSDDKAELGGGSGDWGLR